MPQLPPQELEYVLQFQHPEKTLAGLPGICDDTVAALFAVSADVYRKGKTRFVERARRAAQDLLTDTTTAELVDCLPFAPNSTVVGLGDSITDDYQSWLEIMRHLLELRRADDGITIVNAGVSGDTTAQMISRFLAVAQTTPDWIVCMPGTNDARLHGREPAKTLVSIEETRKNLAMLRNFAAVHCPDARWIWMTPARVIEDKITEHWFLGPFEMMWRNRDLDAVADAVRDQPGHATVDLQTAFGSPVDPGLLLPDGLHPSVAGQKLIVKTLLRTLDQ